MIAAVWLPRRAWQRRLSLTADFVGLTAAALVVAVASYYLGFLTLLYVAYALTIVAALAYPRHTAVAGMMALTAFEPDPLDFTWPISGAIYEFPPEILPFLPLTIRPIEAVALLVAVSLALRSGPRAAPVRLPWLLYSIPLVFVMGIAYGLYKGAPQNLVYIEARGIIFGAFAFYIALRMRDISPQVLQRALLIASGALAVIVLIRLFVYIRIIGTNVPADFRFAHADVVFLAAGLTLASALFIRGGSLQRRLLWLAFGALMVVAILATGRRSGSLVLSVAILVQFWLLLPKRPLTIIVLASIASILAVAYLGAYWNHPYGTLGEPARAFRSQFAQSQGVDQSSDTYRDIERFNVVRTIERNPLFGVGFGRPFSVPWPLPVLPWWPTQFHTPHNDILWLWLKMGVLGVTSFLALWILAIRRCITAIADHPRSAPVPLGPVTIASALVMFLAFAEFDLVLPSSRATLPLGMLFAAALILPQRRPAAGTREIAPARNDD